MPWLSLLLLLFSTDASASDLPCASLSARDCQRQAHSYFATLKSDPIESTELFDAACAKDDLFSCAIAQMVAKQEGKPLNPATARRQSPTTVRKLETACARNDAYACLGASVLLEYGLGTKRAPELARQRAQQACSLHLGRACSRVGRAWSAEADDANTKKIAVDYFTKACSFGDARGCVDLGYSFERGFGVPRSRLRADQLYRTYCQKGDHTACSYQAMLRD